VLQKELAGARQAPSLILSSSLDPGEPCSLAPEATPEPSVMFAMTTHIMQEIMHTKKTVLVPFFK
jgi:hypothetical protein